MPGNPINPETIKGLDRAREMDIPFSLIQVAKSL